MAYDEYGNWTEDQVDPSTLGAPPGMKWGGSNWIPIEWPDAIVGQQPGAPYGQVGIDPEHPGPNLFDPGTGTPTPGGGFTGATGGDPNSNPYDRGTGQPNPGWTLNPNTGNYDYTAPPSGPSGGAGPGGGGGGGRAGGGGNPNTGYGMFQWPQFHAPGFTPAGPISSPSAFVPEKFSYGDFHAPTLEEAKNQPGYAFGLQEGQGALENANSRLGLVRGGGYLKDLFNYTNAAAEQNYGNVFNQDLNTYGTNRGNAFQNWQGNTAAQAAAYGMNWGVTKDSWDRNTAANQQNYQDAFQNASAEFNPQFQAATYNFNDIYNRWRDSLNSATTIAGYGSS